MHKVDAGGGIATPLTTLDTGETAQRWPSFLPDDRHLLYFSVRGPSSREIRVRALDTTESTSLGAAESNAVYSAGHLLFARGGNLMAHPFDPAARRTTGDPFPVADQIAIGITSRVFAAASPTGALAYWRGGGPARSRLTWMDRTGKTLSTVGDFGAYTNLRLSPDERRVAVSQAGGQASRDIWIIDLARGDTASRLTFAPGDEGDPIWSPDGSRVVFNSNRTGPWNSGFQGLRLRSPLATRNHQTHGTNILCAR